MSLTESLPSPAGEIVASGCTDTLTVPLAGIQPLTTIDFPGKVAAVIFTRGCPWHCRYCHNTALLAADGESVSDVELDAFLEKRVGFLDGVTISGGEPTMHEGLPTLLAKVRSYGYATALHTNGAYPDMLRRVVKTGLVDHVAMDIKGSPATYDHITGVDNSCFDAAQSIKIIQTSSIPCEFRTTWHPALLTEEDVIAAMNATAKSGVRRYSLQGFRSVGVNDEELVACGDVATIPDTLVAEGKRLFEFFTVR